MEHSVAKPSEVRELIPPKCLPLWQRFLLTAIVPTLLLHTASFVIWRRITPESTSSPGGPPDLRPLGFLLSRALVESLFFMPATICVVRMAFRPWRRWYTAIGGGFAGIGVGFFIGGIAVLIIGVASR